MATKLAGGSTKNGRDSNPKNLGVKIFAGQPVKAGMIIVRQRGTAMHPGKNVVRTGDDSLVAKISGVVQFQHKKVRGFHGNLKRKLFVTVVS